MCRVTAYLGPEIRLDSLLKQPDNGLIRQFKPQQHGMLNLAGFGMLSWNDDAKTPGPLVYRNTTVPIYDANLDSLSRNLSATTLLAHVRGIPYEPSFGYGPQNLHPFKFLGARLALAHNGDISDFEQLRMPLLKHIRPELAAQIRSTTDSEYVYALFLSQLDDWTAEPDDDEIIAALSSTLRILTELRRALESRTRSSLNLVICDENLFVGARLTLDYGQYPLDTTAVEDICAPYLGLWYTDGQSFAECEKGWRMLGGGTESNAVILSSEPLTRDTTGWVEVPEYSALVARRKGEQIRLNLREVPF